MIAKRLPVNKRFAIGRQYVDGQLRIALSMDGCTFWAEIPKEAVEQYGIVEVCRRGKKVLHEMAYQRRLCLLNGPSPSALVH